MLPVMKPNHLSLIILIALLLSGCATRSAVALQTPTVVETACGECKFGLKGDDCDLAIRVDGHSYFVDGVNPDSLGDAHAKDGICEAIRQARVTGEVRDGRFVATSFVLLSDASR
jgi:hypothetical protein